MEISALHKLFLQTKSVSTDSRKIGSNSIYFALSGERFNGNDFAIDALNNGALYAVVDAIKYKDYPDFFMVGIDLDEPLEKVISFGETVGITYPLALDPGGKLFHQFAAQNSGVTRNILSDREGNIIMLTRLFDEEEFKESFQESLEKIEKHALKIPKGDRTGTVIEPMLTDQWYVAMTKSNTANGKSIAQEVLDVVKAGEILVNRKIFLATSSQEI